ncbi:MAG TPA: biotin--protein ligase [Rhodanobacteraceae bacterium]
MTEVTDAPVPGGENPGMHGEYKMPGGKLVVADFESRDGLLAGVRISGDFFLEPDGALDLINAALTGHPLSATQDALAAAVHAALGDEVRMYGISAEAVAIAVRRALESAP